MPPPPETSDLAKAKKTKARLPNSTKPKTEVSGRVERRRGSGPLINRFMVGYLFCWLVGWLVGLFRSVCSIHGFNI
jgi:hypothetical protein